MKILLVDPPRFDKKSRLNLKLQHNLPKIGLLSLASVLIKNNIKTSFVDLQQISVNSGISEESIKQILLSSVPDIIAVSYNVTEVISVQKFSKIVKRVLPDVKLVFGGAQPSAAPKEVFELIPEADFVVYGEGEQTFIELINALENKQGLGTIKGLAYREGSIIKVNEKRGLITNLNRLPFPAWHLVDLKKYSPSPTALYAKGLTINACTSRGCTFNCAYCNKQVYGNVWRGRSAKNILEEMRLLKIRYAVKNIYFFEDIFTLDKTRVHNLCRLLQKEKLSISWSCMTRTDCVDKALLREMKRAGCKQIAYGIESASERVNKLMNRNYDIKKAKEIIDLTKEQGIETRGFFLIGFPTETREEIMQTINTAVKLDLDISFLSIIVPYPGTVFWNQVKDKINFKSWKQFDVYDPSDLIYVTEKLKEKELLALYSLAYRKIYLRPRYVIKSMLSLIKNPYSLRRYRIGSFLSLIRN